MGQLPACIGSATQTAASSCTTCNRLVPGKRKNIWQTAVTSGFHSTATTLLRVCFRQNRASEPADYIADLAGRCCESGDLIGENMAFPTPAVGDTVAVLVTGAYNYSMASNYNRVPRPAMVMVRNGEDRLVVRRETFEDIIACDL